MYDSEESASPRVDSQVSHSDEPSTLFNLLQEGMEEAPWECYRINTTRGRGTEEGIFTEPLVGVGQNAGRIRFMVDTGAGVSLITNHTYKEWSSLFT